MTHQKYSIGARSRRSRLQPNYAPACFLLLPSVCGKQAAEQLVGRNPASTPGLSSKRHSTRILYRQLHGLRERADTSALRKQRLILRPQSLPVPKEQGGDVLVFTWLRLPRRFGPMACLVDGTKRSCQRLTLGLFTHPATEDKHNSR